MLEQLSIERPAFDDVESIHEVFTKSISGAFEKEGLGHLKDDIQGEIEDKKRILNLALTSNDVYFLVAKVEGRPVGTISFGPCNDIIRKLTDNQMTAGELGTLYILPEYQGKGIASALIHALIEMLGKDGVEQFCLDSGYKEAQARWTRKFGEPYMKVKNYWSGGNDHIIWLCNVKDFFR